MNKTLPGFVLFPAIIVVTLVVGIIGQGCGGNNPPFAPFGSTVTIVDPLGDFFIPPDTLAITQRIQALVVNEDGDPLNDVRVRFSLSFAANLDNVIDTDGDGLGDEAALQLVDPDNCFDDVGVACDEVGVDNFLDLFEFGGTVSSPYTKLTDDRGIAEVFILISGDVIVDPANFEASTDSGSVDSFEFGVNVP